MNSEQKVYELENIWTDEWLSEADTKRIEFLSKLVISKKVTSIADIGCGNGLFLNYLKNNYNDNFNRLCGIERSESAISKVNTEKYVASINSIPLKDKEFDFVSCQEVIEHLPNDIFQKSISELGRISSKYIMISVPYNEDLENSLVSCPSCKTRFNPEYHMRSFTSNELKALEDILGAKVIEIGYINVIEYAFPKLLGKVFGVNNSFPIHTICPMCGYNENSKLTLSVRSTSSSGIKKIGKKIWPKKNRKRWIYALYKKS
jgi:SAM-dependent methyltransferase